MGSFHVLFPCIVQGGQSFRSLPSSPSRAPENWDFMVSMTAWIVKSWPFPQLTFRPSQFCGLEDDLPKIGTRKFQALNVGEVWGKHGSFVAQYPGNIQHCMDADGPLVSHLYDQVETLDFQTCWRWQQIHRWSSIGQLSSKWRGPSTQKNEVMHLSWCGTFTDLYPHLEDIGSYSLKNNSNKSILAKCHCIKAVKKSGHFSIFWTNLCLTVWYIGEIMRNPHVCLVRSC